MEQKRPTPQLRDEVLRYISDRCPLGRRISYDYGTKDYQDFLNLIDGSYEAMNVVFRYFRENGLLEDYSDCSVRGVVAATTIRAEDFLRIGGFEGQELRFKDNLEKLRLEIESYKAQLEPDKLDKSEKMTTIINNLSTIVPTLLKMMGGSF